MGPSNTSRSAAGGAVTVHGAAFAELGPRTLYGILALRSAVFVVEQQCVYLDPDGRDAEPGARHLWAEDADGTVVAALRLLEDPDGAARIGRVVTAPAARGRGLAAELMSAALQRAAGREVVLAAQSYLERWYARFGFTTAGPEFLEDGIPHLPMHRPAATREAP